MEIRSSINSMGLQQFNELLAKPIKVNFPAAALTQPEISWHDYSGFINLDDLPGIAKEVFKRNFSAPEEQSLEDKCIHMLVQIDQCKDVLKKVESLREKILTKWKQKTLGGIGSFFNETWSKYNTSLKAFKQELNQQKKQIKYIWEEKTQADFVRNIFNLFQDFQSIPKQSFFFFSSDNGNFFNIFNESDAYRDAIEPTEQSIDPYQVMDLPRNSTPAQIKTKYHQLAIKLHPDKNLDDPQAKEKFQELNNAYTFLKKKFQIS